MNDRDISIRLSAASIELLRAALAEHADANRGTDRERQAHALADELREALDEYRRELWQASGRSEGRKRKRSGLGSATHSAD